MNYREIGYRIQIAREECNMNQKTLAEQLNISQASLSNYEKGKRRLYLSDLQKIANVLDKPLEYFLQPISQLDPSGLNDTKNELKELAEIVAVLSELSEEDRKIVYDYISNFAKQRKIDFER